MTVMYLKPSEVPIIHIGLTSDQIIKKKIELLLKQITADKRAQFIFEIIEILLKMVQFVMDKTSQSILEQNAYEKAHSIAREISSNGTGSSPISSNDAPSTDARTTTAPATVSASVIA